MKKILIYGYFGYENLGDELILKSIIHLIKSLNCGIEVNVMGGKPKSIEKYHNDVNRVSTNISLDLISMVRTLKYNPIKVFKNIISNDALIIGSGGAISDWNPDSTKGMFSMIKTFKALGKPIMIIGAGAGPITKEGERFRSILKEVKYITVRDKESYNLLKNIGLKNLTLTNDVVFDLKDEMKIFKNHKGNKVGVVVAPLLLNSEEKKKDYLLEIVNYIKGLKKEKINVELLPFQYEYDIEFLEKIRKKVKVPIIRVGKKNVWKLLEEFERCNVIVGLRFHSVILGLISNKPILPICYHSKVDSCIREFGLEDLAQNIGDGENWINSNLDYKKMIKDTLYLIEHSEEIMKKQNEILDTAFMEGNKNILQKFLDEL